MVLKDLTLQFDKELQQISNILHKLTLSDQKLIEDISHYVLDVGGKRLRPLLTIISAKLFGYEGMRHVNLAASVEFIHTATLLHDDVVDNALTRRGRKSAKVKWGNKSSILVGDYLFSQAFRMMAEDGDIQVLGVLSKAASIIAAGEVMQLSALNDAAISELEYFKIISAKTAELFAAACQVGAIIANQHTGIELLMKKFGYNLGMAFQLIDDVLDYVADKDFGKEIGQDFSEGKFTLPVIYAYGNGTDAEQEFWLRTMAEVKQEPEDFSMALTLLNNHDAFNYASSIARLHIQECNKILDKLEDNEMCRMLRTIIAFSITRSY